MAVIRAQSVRNVGSFFSDYYLFELLDRKHHAELGADTRDLVMPKLRRAFRRADSLLYGAALDLTEARTRWYRPLLESLGYPLEPVPEAHETSRGLIPLQYAVPGSADDAPLMLVALLPWNTDPDNEGFPAREGVTPETVDRAMDRLVNEGVTRWALMLAGPVLRLYRAGGQVSRQFLEVEFRALFDKEDPAELTAFWGLLHHEAFLPRQDGRKPLIERVGEESYRCSQRIADDLRENAQEALEQLLQGALADPGNRKRCWGGGLPGQGEAEKLFQEGLHILYRLIFIFFAESRDLLPISNPLYRENYSLDHLRDMADGPDLPIHEQTTYFWDTLTTLFRLLHSGLQTNRLQIAEYDGLLFSEELTPLLEQCRIADRFLRRVVRELSLSRPMKKWEARQRVAWDALDVDQIGSIYEGLLVYEPQVAYEDLAVVRLDGVEQIMSLHEARESGHDILETKPAGSFLLRMWGGRRKGTGSYYTPSTLSRFLVKETLEPLVSGKSAREILELKVLDPAMGSGAFLVQACRYLGEELARARLREGVGESDKFTAEELSRCKREVAEHCLYGVDLNPLAVELAKVSLWLETMANDRPLSFLDHRLRCGNSLVGAWLDDLDKVPDEAISLIPKGADATFKERVKRLVKDNRAAIATLKNQRTFALGGFDSPTDLLINIAQQRRDFERPARTAADIKEKQRALEALWALGTDLGKAKQAFDLWCATWFRPSGEVAPHTGVFVDLMRAIEDGPSVPQEAKWLETARIVAERERFFHWQLEFPEVFVGRKQKGFDAVVGNPPWDVEMINSQEFFSNHDPEFRTYKKQIALVRQEELCEDPKVAREWERYQMHFQQFGNYLTGSRKFSHMGKGHPNRFKLFLQRFHDILRQGGLMGIIVPSGLYTDQGCTNLRRLFLEQNTIQFIFGFENKEKLFPIHAMFKFVLFGAKKGGRTHQFRAGFMYHTLEDLAERPPLMLSADTIGNYSPDSLSLMEFRTQRDADVTRRIFDDHVLLGQALRRQWNVDMGRELNMSDDSDIFRSIPSDMPLYEGKMIWQYDHRFEQPQYWVRKADAAGRINAAHSYGRFRVAFRDVAASTNEVTLIATVLPKGAITGHSLFQCYSVPASAQVDLWLCSLLNSFAINFIQRQKITSHNSIYFMAQLPIIRTIPQWPFTLAIIPRAARLVCTTPEFAPFWAEAFDNTWRQVAPDCEHLRKEWRPEFGITDETERAVVRADIEGLVAHLYGLTEEEFAYIFTTFPVLERKETERFGFFRSRDWSLERYRAFAPLLRSVQEAAAGYDPTGQEG